MPKKTKPDRPMRVAVFITNYRDHFVREFVKGVEKAARHAKAQLVVVQTESRDVPIGSRYQYNALFDIFRFGSIDGLILPTGIMFNFTGVGRAIDYCKAQNELPIVSVGWPLDGYTSLFINNETGLTQALDHLIQVHGRRQIAFIKGRSQNYDAMERFSGFLSSLSYHGMLADPDLIVEGDFTPTSGSNAVDILLLERKKSFDAVVASNDDMALAVIKRLQQLGKRVPEDVAVIGFDNLPVGANTLPGLSSIDQQIGNQGILAVQLLLKKLKGGDLPLKTVLDSRFVPRCSCGCLSDHVALFLDDRQEVYQPVPLVEPACPVPQDHWELLLTRFYRDSNSQENLTALERLIQEILQSGAVCEDIQICFCRAETKIRKEINPDPVVVKRCREFIHLVLTSSWGSFALSDNMDRIYEETEYLARVREMVGSTSLDELKRWLINFLVEFGINRAFLAFYPEPLEYKRGDSLNPPDVVIPFLLFKDGKLIPTEADKVDFPLMRFIPGALLENDGASSLICYPLFFKDSQYGYALFQKDHLPVYLLNTLADQIGASYRLIITTDERERVEKKLRRVLLELEESNKELFNLSKTDELTGLNNRRGFFDQAAESLDLAKYRLQEGTLFFIDLDGLKLINDRYGHDQGDKSIKAVAEILKKIFNRGDVLARLGGDEFIVMSIGTPKEYADEISFKIRDCLSILNQTSGFPVELSMSMGSSHFSPDSDKNLQSLMVEADDNLYKEKNIKKQQNLVRSGFSFRQTAL